MEGVEATGEMTSAMIISKITLRLRCDGDRLQSLLATPRDLSHPFSQ